MQEIEIEGKTVTIAVEAGLEKLGLARSEVEVVVIDEGSAGFLGIGMKPAKVRIRPKHWSADGTAAAPAPATPPPQREERRRPRPASERPPRPANPESRPSSGAAHDRPPRTANPESRREPRREARPPRSAAPERRHRAPEPRAQRSAAEDPRPQRSPAPEPAREPRKELREIELSDAERANACTVTEAVLKELFTLAGVTDARIRTSWDGQQSRVLAEVETADAGLLIGKGGKTLESLQFLVTVIVGRKTGKPTAIQVETESYWKRIEGKILSEAEHAAEEVKRTGTPFRFEPMEPALRRLIHRRLADNPDVETASEGEGPWRKVVLKPRSGR